MDPLAQLSDIHLPEQINNYPIAAGWWVLYLVLFTVMIITVLKIIKIQRRKRAQKRAINHMIQSQTPSDILTILKWVVMEYYPRAQVASLSGTNLQKFLIAQLKEKHQSKFQQSSEGLFNAVYQKTLNEQETQQLKESALYWMNAALPPKNKDVITDKEAL